MRCGARSGGGHGKSEACATGRSWADGDRAAVCLDNALDDVQAKAGAAAPVTAPESRENPAEHLRWDAGAFVVDCHRDQAGRAFGSGWGGRGCGGFRGVDRDGYPAVAVAYRVLEQVGEDLAQLVRVGEDRRRLVRRDDEPVLRLS